MPGPATPQSLANHARYVPGYHFVAAAINMTILVWAIMRAVRLGTPESLLTVLIAVALVAQWWYLRAFPLAVQDRLIRLEERLRLERLAPGEGRALGDALATGQLVALRFASDTEVVALAKRVTTEGIVGRKAVKQLIRTWRPDYSRA